MGKDITPCNIAERAPGMTQLATSMLPVLEPLTSDLLEAVQHAKRTVNAIVTPKLRQATYRWLGIYTDLAVWRPISQPIRNAPLSSPVICRYSEYDTNYDPASIVILGSKARRLLWSRALIQRSCHHPTQNLADPGLFLQTVGALCAVVLEAWNIQNTHFTLSRPRFSLPASTGKEGTRSAKEPP